MVGLLRTSIWALAAASTVSSYTFGPSGCANNDSDLLVTTELFTVKGIVSPNSTAVRIFKGVPYAQPPVGVLRFRPPVSLKRSTGLIDATKYAPICIQKASSTGSVYTEYIVGDEPYPDAVQSEDCLYLNIWAPRLGPSASVPVMIWIHGGGLTTGSAAEPYKEGTHLAANQNVIVVSIEYVLEIHARSVDTDSLQLPSGPLRIPCCTSFR